MLTSDFDFELPEEYIASEALPDRAASRMLVVHRESGLIEHKQFKDILSYVQPGDVFALNNTRVVPARYYSNDGTKEILRVEIQSDLRWRCMVKPGKKFRIGHQMQIGEATGTVTAIEENGDRVLEFDRVVDEQQHGHLALPPYMQREDRQDDRERYQTVFSTHDGSIAAPTAGLHFTPEILAQVPHAFVTLHVGVGTFQPVKADRVEEHHMHSENYHLSEATCEKLQQAKRRIAVGTTTTRVLESIANKYGELRPDQGSTNIFIYPPYQFKQVDVLLTNFHLPKSTLLMLVSAFAGKDLVMEAYRQAIAEKYRFYSYGDCMLLI